MWTNPDPFEWAKKTPVEEIAMGGYCKLACQLLHDRMPDAEIFGFPGDISFEHVYLLRAGQAIDIKGLRTLENIVDDVEPNEEPQQITRGELDDAFFISDDDPEEREIVKGRLIAYIDENPEKFGL